MCIYCYDLPHWVFVLKILRDGHKKHISFHIFIDYKHFVYSLTCLGNSKKKKKKIKVVQKKKRKTTGVQDWPT